jgi:hypothetical protein
MTQPQCTGGDCAEQKILADLNEYGWHCMNVVEDDGHPPWTYTIGFFETRRAFPGMESPQRRLVASLLEQSSGALRLSVLLSHPYARYFPAHVSG